MKKIHLMLLLIFLFTQSCKEHTNSKTLEAPQSPKTKEYTTKLFLELPETFNSPASGTIDDDGNIYFTSANLHNEVLIEAGLMEKPAMPTIGKIDKENKLTVWYTFKSEQMDKTSGKLAPFGIDFGPDGNLYVVDMQLWFGGESRILRINVEDGMPVGMETVLKGMSFPNAVAWKGNDLFITDTVLGEHEDGRHISGVYKVGLSELDGEKPLAIAPYLAKDDHDPHLFETFISNGLLKFGANGLTFDGLGNMYTGIMEEGSVHRTTMNGNNEKIRTTPFAEGMMATDGMKWDPYTNRIYIADLFANAVYAIDMNGKLELLAKNGNTDGSDGALDGPSEVVIRDGKAIVLNFDAAFDHPKMTNKFPDSPHTLSVIELQ
ncbi:MAG: hypothetical protein AAF765_02605 [Bacteroidota bacterium]